jgi:hydrogenase maturation protein HypF
VVSLLRVKLLVLGIVQASASPLHLPHRRKAWLSSLLRNRGDAGVEIALEGEKQNIDAFTADLVAEKPIQARIDQIKSTQLTGPNQYHNFTIIPSSQDAEQSGSIIPPDIAICDSCLRELHDPQNPRHDYFFITCTDCGPRFTTIERLPYDRENTTMREFPLCDFCRQEYFDPLNRRFHARSGRHHDRGPKVYPQPTGQSSKTPTPSG